jgi:hypothetical protein
MEGEKMKSAIRLFLIIAVCGALGLPGVAMADREEDVGKLNSGPGEKQERFYIEKGSKFLSIQVVNGSGNTKTKVSSARVLVDGNEVFGPRDFDAGKRRNEKNPKIASMIRPFKVGPDQDVVDVKVVVKGSKDSEVSVEITGIYEEEAPPVLEVYFFDGDGDGVGGGYSILESSDNLPPGSWVLHPGDCNDTDPSVIYPPDPGCLF